MNFIKQYRETAGLCSEPKQAYEFQIKTSKTSGQKPKTPTRSKL